MQLMLSSNTELILIDISNIILYEISNFLRNMYIKNYNQKVFLICPKFVSQYQNFVMIKNILLRVSLLPIQLHSKHELFFLVQKTLGCTYYVKLHHFENDFMTQPNVEKQCK